MGTLFFVAPREDRHRPRAVAADAGGVTVPGAIGKRPGIGPRTVPAMWDEEGRLVAVKEGPDAAASRARAKGLLPNGLTVEEYIESLCG